MASKRHFAHLDPGEAGRRAELNEMSPLSGGYDDDDVREIVRRYVEDRLYLALHQKENRSRLAALNRFLARGTVRGTLYRKSTHDPHRSLVAGDVVDYAGRVSSWSKDPDVCRRFRPEWLDYEEDGRYPLLCIDADGVRGVDVSDLNPHEQEVLLAAGLVLRIVDVVGDVTRCAVINTAPRNHVTTAVDTTAESSNSATNTNDRVAGDDHDHDGDDMETRMHT